MPKLRDLRVRSPLLARICQSPGGCAGKGHCKPPLETSKRVSGSPPPEVERRGTMAGSLEQMVGLAGFDVSNHDAQRIPTVDDEAVLLAADGHVRVAGSVGPYTEA